MDCQAGVASQQRHRDVICAPLADIAVDMAKSALPGIYFNWLLISESFSAMLMPRALTSPMMASAMAAAIRQYSMAVAPDSSAKNRLKVHFNIRISPLLEVADAKPCLRVI
jgi:hypothetical protein